jgi:hypothetical protein
MVMQGSWSVWFGLYEVSGKLIREWLRVSGNRRCRWWHVQDCRKLETGSGGWLTPMKEW